MYKSPISIMYDDMQMQMEERIMRAIQPIGIHVDRDELLRALQYDRKQYEKGYADGLAEGKTLACTDIEEMGMKICEGYDACTERCPGFDYCSTGSNGMVNWLKMVMECK